MKHTDLVQQIFEYTSKSVKRTDTDRKISTY